MHFGKTPASLFGQRLREVRLRVGIAQDKLGVAIGLDESTASARISRYETGAHAPPYDIAVKLAEVLGIPTAFLYCDDEELAKVIVAWGEMTKSERQQFKAALLSKV